MSDEDPGDSAGDRALEVLREPTAAPKPRECALDHPSARDQLESAGPVGTLDDFDGPATEFVHGVTQLLARIAAVGEHVAKPWIEVAYRSQQFTAPSRS